MSMTTTQFLTPRQHAWLYVLHKASQDMATAAADRRSMWGIAVSYDRHSIKYQLAERRRNRALMALTGFPWPTRSPVDFTTDAAAWSRQHHGRLRTLRAKDARHR